MLNQFVLNTVTRYVTGYVGTALVTHGVMTGETWQTVVGVLGAAVVAGIGAYSSRDKAAIARVNGIPGVAAVPAYELAYNRTQAEGNAS